MQRRVVLVAFFCVYIATGALGESQGLFQEAVKKMRTSSTFFLNKNDVEVKFGGRIRQETFSFFSPLVLRSDYFDRYTFERARFNFDVDSSFGKQKYGESVVDAHIRLTTFSVIDNNDAYTPIVLEPVAFSSGNYIRKADISDHQHNSTVVLTYLEDGFIKVKLEKLLPLLVPTELKVGYFSHVIGRGVSLGDYFGGGVDYLGWSEEGNLGNNTHLPPGLTITIGDRESLALEAYYCQWKKQSQGPDHTRKELYAKRLDRDELCDDPRSIERGVSADRNLFSLRGIIKHNAIDDGYFSYIEPYVVYVNAPELKVEFEGDASVKMSTFGCMVDWGYNGWRVNAEVAVQFGSHVMHPIDRNHVVYNDAYYVETATKYGSGLSAAEPQSSVVSGRLDANGAFPAKYHSHVLLGITSEEGLPLDSGEFLPYQAYYMPDELAHVNADRMLAQQGSLVRTGAPVHPNDALAYKAGQIHQSKKFNSDGFDAGTNDSMYSPYSFKSGIDFYDTAFDLTSIRPLGTYFNANIPFGAGVRFRDKYTLDLAGVMGLLDVSYTLPSKKTTLSAAVGYISGDDYPFNTEIDKRYGGFIPLRDANYQGHIVKSYAVLAARRIARPSTYADNLLYATNNYADSSNVQFFGFGLAFRPCNDAHVLSVENNLLYFWECAPPFTWDPLATRDFGNDQLNGIWQKLQSDLHFTGYQTSRRASKQLGLELNSVITWCPVPSIEVRALFAMFVPGKLYEDINGTPNQYGVRMDSNGDVHLDSLGRKVPFGGMLRLTYLF